MASTTVSITVDEKFARFGSKSYAIAQITSVGLGKTSPSRLPLVIFGVLAFTAWIAALGSSQADRASTITLAVILSAISWALWRRKPDYHLVLATAGGEVQPTTSKNAAEILALRDAIEAEIAKR